ncbi:DUF4435 domain-containing protein [Proteus penneri]|uniref:DUF4435 domain-containing protein n=1 Tax=Proteus penneri TaxID=102862 RepID=A0A0G4Q0A9_9GAMM|nr:DUF4435 domain-containing protein [Proteus penneri]CRL59066.1 hypothetical protein BN1804_00239 [Proteus penneri]
MRSLQQESSELSWVDKNRLIFNHASTENKIVLLVEGDSDRRFFYKIFKCYSEQILIESPDSGKPEVINAVNKIRSLEHKNIYGICDTDFDYITGKIDNYDRNIILFTDFHDLEVTLLTLDIFDDIYTEYTIFDILTPNDANSLKENIFNISYDIGLLKLANEKENFNLNFKSLVHNKYISADGINLTLDIDFLIDDLISKSPRFNNEIYSKMYILEKYSLLKIAGYDKHHICNGHDFCEILSLCYRQDFSKDKNLNRNKIESDLRLTCTDTRFSKSNLYNLLKNILSKHNIDVSTLP